MKNLHHKYLEIRQKVHACRSDENEIEERRNDLKITQWYFCDKMEIQKGCGHGNQCFHFRGRWICQQTWNSKQKSNAIYVNNQNMPGIDECEKNPTIQGWEKLLGGIKRCKFPFLKFPWQINFRNTLSQNYVQWKNTKKLSSGSW